MVRTNSTRALPYKYSGDEDEGEDEYTDDPSPVELESGMADVTGESTINEALLELIPHVVKLQILLLEADSDEHKNVADRLRCFKGLVQALPENGSERKRMGFNQGQK